VNDSGPPRDVSATVAALRSRIARRRAAVLGRDLPVPEAGDATAARVDRLRATWDVYHVARGRGPLGRVVAPVRYVLRRLLAPLIGRQVEYNAVNAELVVQLVDEIAVLADQQARTADEVAALRDAVRTLEATRRG
jgi:hypothetical protein